VKGTYTPKLSNMHGVQRKQAAPKSGFLIWPRVQLMQLVCSIERNSPNALVIALSLLP